jgi:hypothetical protein
MRTSLISGLALLLSTAAIPAVAAPSAADNTASQGSSQPSDQADSTSQPRQRARGDDRQICVNEAMSTGRIRRRVCHTEAEWRALQDNDGQ